MPWEQRYESCVCETNPHKLRKLILDLEDAIVFRYHALTGEVTGTNESDDSAELLVVRRVARRLRRLKFRKFGWSAAEKPTLMDEIAGKTNAVLVAWRTGVRRIEAALLATQRAWQNWVFKSLK